MNGWSRRKWLAAFGAAVVGTRTRSWAEQQEKAPVNPIEGRRLAAPLDIKDFEPRTMLHLPETPVPRPRFAVIDVHAHFGFGSRYVGGVPLGEQIQFLATPEELLPVMDRKGIRLMVNVTGGVGAGLEESLNRFQRPHPHRFLTFVEPRWERANRPEYPKQQADEIERAQRAGARGLKVLKVLGLYLRESITQGPLVKVDDRRFDPMWEVCGQLSLPVAIHVSDPEAFFLPTDRFNERFEELNNHPDWSFHGGDFPRHRELLDALNRVMARHPRTQFLTLHFGNDAENLGYVAECMDQYPNMHVELGARIGELGRQPRAARRFFDRYQDRILFGTDAVPHGDDVPQQLFGDALYEIYYRFLETEDEHFDYAPARVPPQGRWRISGLGLPDGILKKVYHDNAERLLRLA
jgi:predicted TIM-barrel fold metal-dependent hydrolase